MFQENYFSMHNVVSSCIQKAAGPQARQKISGCSCITLQSDVLIQL